MLNSKLQRIKELIDEKLRIDAELAHLIGESERPMRGRRKKEGENNTEQSATS